MITQRFLKAGLLAMTSFLMSCSQDQEPNFPIEPEIKFIDLSFQESSNPVAPDSLVLTFYFSDGDKDLGLDGDNPVYIDSPYHALNYFLEDNNGGLLKVSTNLKDSHIQLSIPPAYKNQKLVSVRTRNKTEYNFLPEFSCVNYIYDELAILGADKGIFDETYAILDTISNPETYILKDTFYVERNENFYNIQVDFLVKQPDDSFSEFEFEKPPYCETFNNHLTGCQKDMLSKSPHLL